MPHTVVIQAAQDENQCLLLDANQSAILGTCNGTPAQTWDTRVANGNTVLRNTDSGFCLTAPTGSGAALYAGACDGNISQLWNLAASQSYNGPPGFLFFTTRTRSPVLAYSADIVVPPQPQAVGNVSLRVFSQSGPTNYEPVEFGLLGPTMVWGAACAPAAQPTPYSTWWISGAYYNENNPNTQVLGPNACMGGDTLSVGAGDTVHVDVRLTGGGWVQTVTDTKTGQSKSYTLDLKGQSQNSVGFRVQADTGGAPAGDVTMRNATFTLGTSDGSACRAAISGPQDAYTSPTLSADGTVCSIAQVTLRFSGAAAVAP